jgi:hypothetical protein
VRIQSGVVLGFAATPPWKAVGKRRLTCCTFQTCVGVRGSRWSPHLPRLGWVVPASQATPGGAEEADEPGLVPWRVGVRSVSAGRTLRVDSRAGRVQADRVDAAEIKSGACERRFMPGRCGGCGDRPGWVEFVFDPQECAVQGGALEMEFSRLFSAHLVSQGWRLGQRGAEWCPGCREWAALAEAGLTRPFARQVWTLLAEHPDWAAAAQALNDEPTLDEQTLTANLQVMAEREGVTGEEMLAFRREMEESLKSVFGQEFGTGLLTRMEMRFERDAGPWFALPLQALLLEMYGELPVGVEPLAVP